MLLKMRQFFPFHCLFPFSMFHFCLLFLTIQLSLGNDDQRQQTLPMCRNLQQACAAEIRQFPRLPIIQETVPDVLPSSERLDDAAEEPEGSGEAVAEGGAGSGGGGGAWHFVPMSASISFPLYDEFVPTTPSYDYAAEPTDTKQMDICACPDEQQCEMNKEDSTVQFNAQLRVSFCRPIEEVFKLKCKGTRTLARVIGMLDRQKSDMLTHVNDTLIFCRCESERWSRVMVEPWINNFSFSFKCLPN